MPLPFANKIRKPPQDGIVLSIIIDYGRTNQIYDIPNAYLVSFECKRNAKDASNSFTLVMKSSYCIDLEANILTSNQKISITYGWRNETKTLIGTITGADTKFEGLMMAFSITGVISSKEDAVFNRDTKKRTCNWQAGTTFNKIMTLICGAHGWKLGFTVNAKPLSDDVPQSDMTDTDFLRKVLSGELITSDDRKLSDYTLWFTFDGNTTYLNYAPLEYRKDTAAAYVYDLSGSANSRLISFEISNNGELAFNVGASMAAEAIDEDTGAMVSTTSAEQRKALAKLSQFAGGRRVVFTNNGSSRAAISNARNSNAILNKYWLTMAHQALQAKATFMGDLALEMGGSVNIAVILDDGRYHYSTGLYTITELVDTIDSNGFQSTAQLIKTDGSSAIGSFVDLVNAGD